MVPVWVWCLVWCVTSTCHLFGGETNITVTRQVLLRDSWGEGAKTLTCKIVSRSPMWQPMHGKGLAQYRRKGDGDAWRGGQGRADYSRPRARAGQSHHHGQGGRRCAGALING